MSGLIPAHRGYEYQDLLVACRLVDMLLGNVLQAYVDEKLVSNDRFDDLTTVDALRNRERIQFKHTDNNDRPLALRTFTTDGRSLRLDCLIRSMLLDRDGPGSAAETLTFRIVLRDQEPNDPALTNVLKKLDPDPGSFLSGMKTTRLGFNTAMLWNQSKDPDNCPFSFLFTGDAPLSYDELEWVCNHLIVEVGAPASSADLTAPNMADLLLLTRARAEVGAESFPNEDRSCVDVAEALVSTARAARQDRLKPTLKNLLRRTQLRSDFGAVARSHPVDSSIEVLRPKTVQQFIDEATRVSTTGGYLILTAPPGHGKSWICQQFLTALSEEGWLTAEHYCYLGDADGELLERVLSESVYGSILSRLAEADPRLVTDHRPRFSADEEAVIACLNESLNREPNRRVAIFIDGIDHITRVRTRHSSSRFNPSRSLAESLSSLDIPLGAIVVVLSQPGSHLQPLTDAGARTVSVPGLDYFELSLLSEQLNIVPSDEHNRPCNEALIVDSDDINEFLDALAERSGGNALYATYLCREMLRNGDTHASLASAVRSLPPFDGTLKNYYEYLYQVLGPTADWVADVVALIDFAVTRVELREIRPDCAHYVDKAIIVLEPVLVERATQGGVRVYHESFARYLRDRFGVEDEFDVVKSLLGRISNWLEEKGFLKDQRAFSALLTVLFDAEQYRHIVELVDQMFITEAVAAGFPSSGIIANLATAISAAAKLEDWPTVIRYVEMSRAAESYQSERFDTTLVAFADVPASLLGADILAARLVYDDHLVMSARAGIQMCAAVDALGATPPWHEYMGAFLREEEADNTSYGAASDLAVRLAWLRGRLRLSTFTHSFNDDMEAQVALATAETEITDSNDEAQDLRLPISWTWLANRIETDSFPLDEVISAVEDTHGLSSVIHLTTCLQKPGNFYLALAERLTNAPVPDPEMGSSRSWAIKAAESGCDTGSVHRLLRLGIAPADITNDLATVTLEKLLELTRRFSPLGK